MHLDCPACGKITDAATARTCARCGCELDSLIAVRRGCDWHLARAKTELQAQRWSQALRHAEQAWALRHSPDAFALAQLAAIGLGDFQAASRWYGRARTAPR